MSQNPDNDTEKRRDELREWRLDLSRYGTANAELDPPAANDNSTWQSIGNLSLRVLNGLGIEGGDHRGDGRESLGGLSASGEEVASKRKLL